MSEPLRTGGCSPMVYDEIPPDVQSKLVRVLQEREFERVGDETPRRVDVRVIARHESRSGGLKHGRS